MRVRDACDSRCRPSLYASPTPLAAAGVSPSPLRPSGVRVTDSAPPSPSLSSLSSSWEEVVFSDVEAWGDDGVSGVVDRGVAAALARVITGATGSGAGVGRPASTSPPRTGGVRHADGCALSRSVAIGAHNVFNDRLKTLRCLPLLTRSSVRCCSSVSHAAGGGASAGAGGGGSGGDHVPADVATAQEAEELAAQVFWRAAIDACVAALTTSPCAVVPEVSPTNGLLREDASDRGGGDVRDGGDQLLLVSVYIRLLCH